MAVRRPLGFERLEDRSVPAGLDPSFGTGGTAIVDVGPNDQPCDLIVQDDGKVVALAGRTDGTSGEGTAYLVRLNADGTRDASFSGDGVADIASSFNNGYLGTVPGTLAFNRVAGGKYLVAWTTSRTFSPDIGKDEYNVRLARYNADGTPDDTYAPAPFRTAFETPVSARILSLLVRADGSVLVAAIQKNWESPDVLLADAFVYRINPDGTADPSFGTGGSLRFTVGGFPFADVVLHENPRGGFILTGEYTEGDPPPPRPVPVLAEAESPSVAPGFFHVYAAKVSDAGVLDAAYGTGGVYRTDIPEGTSFVTSAVAADGAVLQLFNVYDVTLGYALYISPRETPAAPFLRRVTPDGKLDGDYGVGPGAAFEAPAFRSGYIGTEFITTGGYELDAVADGGAYITVKRTDGLFVAKLTATGTLDPAYGDGGLTFVPDADSNRTEFVAAVAPDGDLVVIGQDGPGRNEPVPAIYPPPPVLTDLFLQRFDAAAPTPELPETPGPTPIPIPIPIPIPVPQPPATQDITGDGVSDDVRVSGNTIQVFDGATGAQIVKDFRPYEAAFTGGLQVAFADLDGDGKSEIIVAPDVGGGARVQVLSYDGTSLFVKDNFFAIDDAAFRGGARVACGDIDGDGTADLVVTAGPGGGPRAAIFDGRGLLRNAAAPPKLIDDFFAFPGEDAVRLRDGATVAVGDIDGDGRADVAFGSGPGGGPRVFVLPGSAVAAGRIADAQNNPLANFFAGGDGTTRGGSRVSLFDIDDDGKADLTVTDPLTNVTFEYNAKTVPGAVGEPPNQRYELP